MFEDGCIRCKCVNTTKNRRFLMNFDVFPLSLRATRGIVWCVWWVVFARAVILKDSGCCVLNHCPSEGCRDASALRSYTFFAFVFRFLWWCLAQTRLFGGRIFLFFFRLHFCQKRAEEENLNVPLPRYMPHRSSIVLPNFGLHPEAGNDEML